MRTDVDMATKAAGEFKTAVRHGS